MAEGKGQTDAGDGGKAPVFHVAPSPHLFHTKLTTRRLMVDVLIGLAPVVVAALIVFRGYAAMQIAICVVACLAAEGLFSVMRGRMPHLGDCSAAVTGLILALSMPGTSPWYVSVLGSFAAIGLGKTIFGGLGQNIFNPAMVGRAFVLLAFAGAMGASAYVVGQDAAWADAVTQATPLTAAKAGGEIAPLGALLLGNTNGSLGETSALACLLGGAWLLIRRTISWHIPAGVLGAVVVIGGLMHLFGAPAFTAVHHLLGGALLFGAFFIATDLVTSPVTASGKVIFGAGVGALVMLLRTLSNYPEGVMFAVLLMNAVTPLINRWTIPRPLGEPAGGEAEGGAA